ncbi:alpha/beta fold hydrolase [Gordonia sp. CPCC 206044]|uniref:esterase/lipase family protein n=1 Tax=Gordonia sp. CPCC 206044 TaxID=3140793 RepID=UPI003AF3B70E
MRGPRGRWGRVMAGALTIAAALTATAMPGAATAAPAITAPSVSAPTDAEIAQAQTLTDYINATAKPGSPRAVNGLRHDTSSRPLGPIANTQGVGPAQRGFWPAFAYSQFHPNVAPPGANDWNCKPRPGQRPIVLVHGTWENAYNNWAAFAPVLKKAGYCVFAPNYGRTDLLNGGGLGTVLPGTNGEIAIEYSAAQLGEYIDRVRQATGATKVDVIGHSQGGLMVRQWMKFGGGADYDHPERSKIGKLITYGATHKGTTLLGIGALGRGINNVGPAFNVLGVVELLVGRSGIQQTVDSPFIKNLNRSKLVFPGVDYTIVGSRYDEVTTPFDLTFIHRPGVNNIVLQDGCPQDTSDHISMSYSPRAMSIALRALDPQRFSTLACGPNPWFFSF